MSDSEVNREDKGSEVAKPEAGATVPGVSRRLLIVSGLLAVLTVLALVAATAWRRHTLPERLGGQLPPTPDLTGRPAILGERLEQARAMTETADQLLDGIAELGRLYQANGFNDEAGTCWLLLHRQQPAEALWLYYDADLRRLASDNAGMETALAEVLERASDYAPAWLRLADLRLKMGSLEGAANGYRRRLALLPGDPHARLGLARVALQSDRRGEARQLLAELVRDVPGFSPAQHLHAQMLAEAGDTRGASWHRWLGREAGRFREAEDPWLDALWDWCFDPTRLFVKGTVDFQTNHGDRGVAIFERAVELAPEDPAGWSLLGDLYLELGDAARARDTLLHSIDLSHGEIVAADTYLNLSTAHRRLGRLEEALRVASEGLVHWPEAYELHNARGVALGDLGRHEEAVAAYLQAITRNPHDADAGYNLAVSLLELGRQDEARTALEQSVAAQPTFFKSLAMLGRWDLEAGDLGSAGNHIRPLFESHPGNEVARGLMAQWEYVSGRAAAARQDAQGAEKHYLTGLEIAPDNPELNLGLGFLYLLQGRLQDALPPLEKHGRLLPGDPQGALFLGQVYARLGRTEDARRILLEGERSALAAGNEATARYCREVLDSL